MPSGYFMGRLHVVVVTRAPRAGEHPAILQFKQLYETIVRQWEIVNAPFRSADISGNT
jgi:hypothetical protein